MNTYEMMDYICNHTYMTEKAVSELQRRLKNEHTTAKNLAFIVALLAIYTGYSEIRYRKLQNQLQEIQKKEQEEV